MAGTKFMALVGAREDEGLLEPCVRNLLRLGFQRIVIYCVEDFADAAPRVAALFSGEAAVRVVSLPDTVIDEGFLELAGPVIGPHVEEFAPEWLLVIDVDEFPLVRGGRIEGIAGLDAADMVVLQRFNLATRRDESESDILARLEDPRRLPLITERHDANAGGKVTRGEIDGDGPRWALHRIGPKVMMRPAVFSRFMVGTHGAQGWRGRGAVPVELRAADALIAHVPFTSPGRFRRKVENARAHLAATRTHAGPQSAWHWKWWVRCLEEERLDAEFRRESLGAEEYALMRARGAIREAREMLADGVAG